MEATLIILVVACGAVALFGWLSRGKFAQDLDVSRAEVAKLREEISSTRKAAERTKEDRKGHAEELASTREKLRDAKKRLHDAGQEIHREREIARVRDEERRLVEQQVAAVREENAQLALELRRMQEQSEAERGRSRRSEQAPAEKPAAAAPVALTPVQVDARLEVMGRKVEDAERRMQDAEKKAQDARRQLDEIREELKRVRGKAEANNRVYLVTKGESELWKAKFGALEQRWNELWRELEGIGWKPRTPKEPGARTDGPGEKRRGPKRDRPAGSRGPREDRGVREGSDDADEANGATSNEVVPNEAAELRAEAQDDAAADAAAQVQAEAEEPRLQLAAGAEELTAPAAEPRPDGELG